MKLQRLIHVMFIGLLGGLSSWSMLQMIFYFGSSHVFPLFDVFMYQGLFTGIGLGIFTYAREALLVQNQPVIYRRMLIGACVGALSGLLSFAIAQSLLRIHLPMAMMKIVSWTLLGMCLSAGASFVFPVTQRMLSQLLSGGIGGCVGGVLFELCQLLPTAYLGNFLGLIFIGICISFSMVLIEVLRSKAYLRVLIGNNEGQTYVLDKDLFFIGYAPQNDIVLNGYSEICEKHARIFKQKDECILQNEELNGQVLINYRVVHQQAMKKGDIIKIGTALLQYCEIQ